MAAESWVVRLGVAAELWIVILYTIAIQQMAVELQFVRVLKVKRKRKLRLFIITTVTWHKRKRQVRTKHKKWQFRL